VWGWSTADGGRISQYTDSGGANQQWRLTKIEENSGGPLPQVHTAGRVKAGGAGVQYSWPGIYFEGRFRGTGVGIVLNDSAADYSVQIDGSTVATLVTPGRTTRWVEGLSDAEHTVRVVKRNESTWSTSEFGGFVAAPGGEILAAPAARSRQIEFIGDSLTVGYGNTSGSRSCPADGVARTTDTDLSYGALTARGLSADYQVNAFSGKGMVRNYNGGDPGNHYRAYYDRALLNTPGDVWDPSAWRPQLVVVYLGTNDFSTGLNPGEQWTTPEALRADYRAAYGQHDASWLAFHDMFRRHCSIRDADRLAGQMRTARSAGWWWPFQGAVVISDRPEALHRDGQARLHCEDGPAIRYRDGFAVWSWHGTRVPQDLIETGWDTDTILRHPNAEVRRCAIEHLGWDQFIIDAGLDRVGLTVPDPANAPYHLALYDGP
jgi:hypothetical protein